MGPARDNVFAVVVTYHPDATAIARLGSLATQFANVIVVDNDSGQETLTALRNEAGECRNVVLINNPKNAGVAAALNQGCRREADEGANWVAMFDQDSAPAGDFLNALADQWALQPERDRIGLVGVNFRKPSGNMLIQEGTGLAEARAVITSGSLLKMAAWRDVGAFREDFFIDEVDHEWALRARRRGWQIKIARRVLMEHTIGSPRQHSVLGWRPMVSHHSALRRYYMVRNRLLMAQEHFRFDPLFVGQQLARSLGESASILLFEPDKTAKLRAMAAGFIDGVRGKTGRSV